MKNNSVPKIIADFLETNGFDGLFVDSGDCACLKEELFPCGEVTMDCEAGYKGPCDCGDHDWHIGPDKVEDAPCPR